MLSEKEIEKRLIGEENTCPNCLNKEVKFIEFILDRLGYKLPIFNCPKCNTKFSNIRNL